MIIDFHTHIWPDKVSRKARVHLEKIYGIKLACDPTLSNLLKFMDKNYIDKSAVCAVASRADQVESINKWIFGIKSERIEIFCSMHPKCKKLQYQMNLISENRGGIKIQPEFQQIFIDDEIMFTVYEHAQKLSIPMLFHSGAELSASETLHSTPEKIMKIKEKFPELKIIAAHYGGFKVWDEVVKHILNKDIYLDTSFFFGFLPKQEVKLLLNGHRKDRILFGTDFPLVDQQNDIDYLTNLDIDPDLKELIFYKNTLELLK